jgi:PTH1 family peptidyl-tRNA hydrolase
MKLIVGLGNPGREYAGTRHNVGFRVLDEVGRRHAIDTGRRRFSGFAGTGSIEGVQVLLLKPTTYMNLSGRSVREAMTFHKLSASDLLVVVDDLALPLARLRVREKGSAGGHNGLTSIIQELGSDEFARLRIGIAWVEGKRMVGHVLGAFTEEEESQIAPAVRRAADAVECWVTQGVQSAMNRFNKAEDPGTSAPGP